MGGKASGQTAPLTTPLEPGTGEDTRHDSCETIIRVCPTMLGDRNQTRGQRRLAWGGVGMMIMTGVGDDNL
jgi:hypothetical protein